jgi:hypothetical protein
MCWILSKKNNIYDFEQEPVLGKNKFKGAQPNQILPRATYLEAVISKGF